MSFVGNALIAKIKNLHATDLTAQDYQELLRRDTIPDIGTYLKKHPAYQDILANVSEVTLNRSRLEGLIRRQKFDRTIKLVNFISLKDKNFYMLSLIKMEHEVILAVIRSYISHEDYDVVDQIPYYFDKYSKIDFVALTKTENVEEMIAALSNTRYAAMLKPYAAVKNDDIRYYEFEALFENDYYNFAFTQTTKNYRGKLRKELLDAFRARIEMENMIKIYRLKKFYGVADSDIKAILIPSSRISERKLDEIIAIKNPDDILKVIIDSGVGPYITNKNQINLEYYRDHMRLSIANRFMYFSTQAPEVFLAYTFLNELEVQNLTYIIEGIRYQIDESEIRTMLVY
ncbi:MAG: V-type ATPase subunit [Bacilli bacterium]|jgi:V/A-type H+-transporting ATPase subunit C|nr:V-type ATPase subunit [Bacilli bacterium]